MYANASGIQLQHLVANITKTQLKAISEIVLNYIGGTFGDSHTFARHTKFLSLLSDLRVESNIKKGLLTDSLVYRSVIKRLLLIAIQALWPDI